jgi:hypothetical protein
MALPPDIALFRPQNLSERHYWTPLDCELSYAIEKNLTVAEAAARHARLFNFDERFSEETRKNYTEHDFLHLLLGLTFLKMGRNPTGYDYGYNGNNQAEAIVDALEMTWIMAFENSKRAAGIPAFEDFKHYYDAYCVDVTAEEHRTLNVSLREIEASPTPLSFFEERYRHRFRFRHGKHGDDQAPQMQQTRFGERVSVFAPLPDQELRVIYEAILPALLALRQRITDEVPESQPGCRDHSAVQGYLSQLRMAEIWHSLHQAPAPKILVSSHECEPLKAPAAIGIDSVG